MKGALLFDLRQKLVLGRPPIPLVPLQRRPTLWIRATGGKDAEVKPSISAEEAAKKNLDQLDRLLADLSNHMEEEEEEEEFEEGEEWVWWRATDSAEEPSVTGNTVSTMPEGVAMRELRIAGATRRSGGSPASQTSSIPSSALSEPASSRRTRSSMATASKGSSSQPASDSVTISPGDEAESSRKSAAVQSQRAKAFNGGVPEENGPPVTAVKRKPGRPPKAVSQGA